MAIWTAVHGYIDGEKLTDDVLNRPIMELKERTDYLHSLIRSFSGSNPFESVRIPDIPLEQEGDYAPKLKDIVYLNPETHKLEKAAATLAVFEHIFSTATLHALSIGILVDITGDTGTVALMGRVYLSDSDSGAWNTADIIEEGEDFRPGPYYLSATVPGKLTANPKGPAIYIGQFLAQVSNPLLLDYAIIHPQYKDVAEAHTHDAVPLVTQPAGTQAVTGTGLNQKHVINGFDPVAAFGEFDGVCTGVTVSPILEDLNADFIPGNLKGLILYNITKNVASVITDNTSTTITTPGIMWEQDDTYKIGIRNRLVIGGTYKTTQDIQYVITLAGLDIANPPVPGAAGFEGVYLHWSSSDPNEGSGSIPVKSYEIPYAIGKYGVEVILENTVTDAFDTVERGDVLRRQWVINVPEQTRGWVANKQRGYFNSVAQQSSILVFGGPYKSLNNRMADTITVTASRIFRLEYADLPPQDGDTLTIDDLTFEFDNNDLLSNTSHIPVRIFSEDIATTYRELIATINAQNLPGITATINTDDKHVVFGTLDTTNIGSNITGTTNLTEINAPGPWSIESFNGFIVYDTDYNALIPETSIISNARYWTPIALKNNVFIMFTPWDAAGQVSTVTVVNTDQWTKQISNEAQGAHFIYPAGMHAKLAHVYPPVPAGCGSLLLNGIELENNDLYPDSLIYRFGTRGIYWYTNQFASVPWPRNWEYYDSSVASEYGQYLIYHSTRMAVGRSSVVTSLRPAQDAPIRLTSYGTDAQSNTGDLAITLDFNLAEEDTSFEGFNVFKAISGNKFLKGPVVSKIEAGPGVTISSPTGVPHGCGRVRIGLASGVGVSGDFEEVALENAKQGMVGMYPYIRLLGWKTGERNINSGFTAKFKIPTTTAVNSRVLLYLTLFGEENIELPVGITPQIQYAGLEFSYSVLHDYRTPTGLAPYGNLIDDLVTLPAPVRVEVPMGILGSAEPEIYKAYDPVIIHNNPDEPIEGARRIMRVLGQPFPNNDSIQKGQPIDPLSAYVTAGSLVAIRIRRTGVTNPANEYSGPLGFISLRWQLV